MQSFGCSLHRPTLQALSLWNKGNCSTDRYSLKWLQTFNTPEGILARWIETLAEFDIEIEHRPGLSHSNIDGMSRPFCKQCFGKEPKPEWVDELERADELTELLGVRHVKVMPEISDDEMKELQAEDPDLGPIVEWLRLGRCSTNEYSNQNLKIRANFGHKFLQFICLMESLFVSSLTTQKFSL